MYMYYGQVSNNYVDHQKIIGMTIIRRVLLPDNV